MQDHTYCQKDNLKIAPDRPILEILKIGLKTVSEIGLYQRSPAKAANLGKTGETWLGSMTIPITLIDFPKELVCRARTQSMRTRSDDAHVPFQHVDQLR